MTFGQLVVGPPGSGKSTFCNGMQQYLTALGRKVAVVNLDPANDSLPYEKAVDIMDLISLEEVMRETGLGPNGDVMMALELPHINVLSKLDLVESQGDLAFNLEYYSEVHDLSHIVDTMGDGAFSQRFKKLTQNLCEVVEDYSMVKFIPLHVEDKESMQRVLALIDKATGYVFTGLAGGIYPPEFLYGAGVTDDATSSALRAYEEKYMKDKVLEK